MGDLSSVSFSNGFSRHKAGRSDVTFSPDGRIIQGGPASVPEATNPNPRTDRLPHDIPDYRSYDADRDHRRHRHSNQDRHHRHNGRQAQNYELRQAHTVDRIDHRNNNYHRGIDNRNFPTHFDRPRTHDYRSRNRGEDHIRTNRPHDRNHRDNFLPTRRRRQQGKCCSKRNPFSFIFIFNAILILGCAMFNILICRDFHYYCGFWVGILVLEFGIIGAFHRGNYKNQCRNWAYILLGSLSTIVAYVGTAMVCEKLIPDIISLAIDSTQEYVLKQQQLAKPYINSNFSSVTQRAWLCLACDCSLVTLYIFDFLILLAVCLVIDKFYTSAYKVTGKVEPWCYPACFNPYGQVPLGQFVALLGIVSRYTCKHDDKNSPWYTYWAPMWSGGLLVVGGFLCAASMKRPDRRARAGITLVVQFISVIACIGAFVLQILGIVDNATQIKSGKDRSLVGSIVIYSIAAFFLLFAIVFSVSLFIKVAFAVCDSDDQEPYRRENRSYSDSNSSSDRPPIWPRRDPSRGYQFGADYYSDWQKY